MQRNYFIPPRRYLVSKTYPVEARWPEFQEKIGASITLKGMVLDQIVKSTDDKEAQVGASLSLKSMTLEQVVRYSTHNQPGAEQAGASLTLKSMALS